MMKMSGKHRVSDTVLISAWGTEIELNMVIDFTVYPGCSETLTEPGEPPSAEIEDINFFEHIAGDKPKRVNIPDWIVERVTGADGFKEWLLNEAWESHQSALEDKADAARDERL